MKSESKVTTISLGGRIYLDSESLLDILAKRAMLITEELRRRGTPLGDTEFLRGQFFEQENLKNVISPPTKLS